MPFGSVLPLQFKKTSQSSGTEWIGGRYTFPGEVLIAGEVVRPTVSMWLELPRGVLVGVALEDPREAAPFAQSLLEAMRQPAEGSPRRPQRLRICDPGLAAELSALDGELTVSVAPTPELDAVFAEMVKSMPENTWVPSYFGGGASARAIGRLFSAASILFHAAPWKWIDDTQVIRVDIPELEVEGGCLSIIGRAGQSYGLLLFESFEAYLSFAESPPQPPDEDESLGLEDRRDPMLLSLSFERKKDVPPSMLREITAHQWPVEGRNAYPTVFGLSRDGRPRAITEREVRALTASATALVAFLATHGDLFEEPFPEPVCASFTDEDELTVTLTAPHDEAVLDLEDAPAVALPKAGRNEPCPCGSGKKYKRCHLVSEEASASSSETVRVHEMDFVLVMKIRKFASDRFGQSWAGRGGKEFESDEAALQLLIPWVVYHSVLGGRRLIETFAQARADRLSDQQRDWLGAQQRAWLSIWEVTEVAPGRVGVRDLLSGQSRVVREDLGSQTLVARDAVLARVVDFRGVSLFGGMYGRSLPPRDADEVVRAVRSRLRAGKAAVPVERLRHPAIGLFMIDRWRDALQELDRRRSIPPKLQNTDGDPLLFVTDTFAFEPAARAEIERRFSTLEDVDERSGGGGEERCFSFLRRSEVRRRSFESTVIGNLVIAPDALRIETNSRKRAAALRRRVETIAGGLLQFQSRQITNPRKELRKRSVGEAAPREAPSAEEQNLPREVKEMHYRDWLDTPVPALDGKTPRAAARGKRTREKLDLLLREMENREHRLPAAGRFEMSRLRRELGLLE